MKNERKTGMTERLNTKSQTKQNIHNEYSQVYDEVYANATLLYVFVYLK